MADVRAWLAMAAPVLRTVLAVLVGLFVMSSYLIAVSVLVLLLVSAYR